MARKEKKSHNSNPSSSLEPVERLSPRLQKKLIKRVSKQQKNYRSSGKRYPLVIVQVPARALEQELQWHHKSMLNGAFFGYPLYPVLTVVSITAWMFTAVFVVTWLIAHPTWAAYAAIISLIVGLLGLVIVISAAYLSRGLVFDKGIRANHPALETGSKGDKATLLADCVKENILYLVTAAGEPLLLLRRGSQLYAISATCPHDGRPLDEGALDGDVVECPWDGSCFCMRDGRALTGPATVKVPCYEVHVRNGQILVRLVDED
jgi:nitrite reductase/ring-hydroxylating ferredoxin subunit